MQSIVRHIALLLLVVITLGLSGCNKQKEPRQKPDKFEIISVDKLTGSMGSEWKVTATLANNTAFNVRITEAQVFVKYEGRKIASIATKDEVLLPRRSKVQVTVPLRLTVASSMTALSALAQIGKGELSKITLDYNLIAAVLASKINISEKDISLEELNREFNLGLKK